MMLSTNPFTRRRQKATAALVAGTALAIGLAALLPAPRNERLPDVSWVGVYPLHLVVRDSKTYAVQTLIDLPPRHEVKRIVLARDGSWVGGDFRVITDQRRSGLEVMEDRHYVWDAHTGVRIR